MDDREGSLIAMSDTDTVTETTRKLHTIASCRLPPRCRDRGRTETEIKQRLLPPHSSLLPAEPDSFAAAGIERSWHANRAQPREANRDAGPAATATRSTARGIRQPDLQSVITTTLPNFRALCGSAVLKAVLTHHFSRSVIISWN